MGPRPARTLLAAGGIVSVWGFSLGVMVRPGYIFKAEGEYGMYILNRGACVFSAYIITISNSTECMSLLGIAISAGNNFRWKFLEILKAGIYDYWILQVAGKHLGRSPYVDHGYQMSTRIENDTFQLSENKTLRGLNIPKFRP